MTVTPTRRWNEISLESDHFWSFNLPKTKDVNRGSHEPTLPGDIPAHAYVHSRDHPTRTNRNRLSWWIRHSDAEDTTSGAIWGLVSDARTPSTLSLLQKLLDSYWLGHSQKETYPLLRLQCCEKVVKLQQWAAAVVGGITWHAGCCRTAVLHLSYCVKWWFVVL